MSIEQDKQKMVRFVDEVLNQDHWDRLDDYVDRDAVDHVVPPGFPSDRDGFKAFFKGFRAAFPDYHYTIDDTLGQGDLIAQRVTGHGTMKGPFLGMPPTGKSATWSELHIVQMKNGKVVEHWGNVDQLNMMMQLGLVPMPGA